MTPMNSSHKWTPFLTEPEAARYLGVCTSTLRLIRRRGEITFARVGRLIRYRRQWVEDYMDKQAVTAGK